MHGERSSTGQLDQKGKQESHDMTQGKVGGKFFSGAGLDM